MLLARDIGRQRVVLNAVALRSTNDRDTGAGVLGAGCDVDRGVAQFVGNDGLAFVPVYNSIAVSRFLRWKLGVSPFQQRFVVS